MDPPQGSDAAHLTHKISPGPCKWAVYEACESSVCSSRVYREVRGRQAAVSNWFCVQVTAIQLQALQRGTDTDELRWQDLKNKRNVWIISEKKKQKKQNNNINLLYYNENLAFWILFLIFFLLMYPRNLGWCCRFVLFHFFSPGFIEVVSLTCFII